MYFYTDELERCLDSNIRKNSASWMREELRVLAEGLLDNPASYQQFGCYWWGLKQLFKQENAGGKRAWFRGSCTDEEIRKRANHGNDLLNLLAAKRYASFHIADRAWHDDNSTTTHICEWTNGQIELYRVSDTDTGHQLDLFEAASDKQHRLERFLKSPSDFLPRTWRAHGDRAIQNGDLDGAIACYQRMILLAGDGMERSEGWLLLGMTFDQKHHWNKAIFCYLNLYEKEKQHWVLGNIAESHAHAGRLREAIEFYEKALQQMPGNPEYESGLDMTRRRLDQQNHDRSRFDRGNELLDLIHA